MSEREFYVDPSDPQIRTLLEIFTLCTRKSVRIVKAESHEIANPEFSAGTRIVTNMYQCSMADGSAILDHPDSAVATSGSFRGKTAPVTIYVHQDRFERLKPASGPPISDEEMGILRAIATYNSRGRADYRAENDVSKETWKATIEHLARLGLTTVRGAITTFGRNTVR